MRQLWIPAAFALFLGTGAAQIPTCTRVDTPGIVRAEGLTELLPDIVVECTGGDAGYQTIYTILLTVQGAWAVRPSFTAPATTPPAVTPAATPIWNEALLIVDDPGPAEQVVCLPAVDFDSCAPRTGANVFPARRLEDTLIGFTEIPLTSPGDGKVRRYRITNLRVNVPLSTAEATTTTTPDPISNAIKTSLQMFDYAGNLVPVGLREAVSATAEPAYSLHLLDASGTLTDDMSPALLALPSAVPLNTPETGVSFLAAFEEGFPNAFRRRNVATSPLDPSNVQSQNVPGLTYSTEAGFFDIALPLTTALSLAGSADSGTRLRLSFDKIPKNIIIWVSIRDTDTGTRNYDPDNPKAMLTYTNPNGDGPFSPVSPYIPGWAQLYNDNGKSEAVWEIVSSDPSAIDRIAFRVALTSQGAAGTGAATLRGTIAPFNEIASTDVTLVDTLTVIPRFAVPALDIAAFTLTNSLKTATATFASAASFSAGAIAPGSFVAAFSKDLTSGTVAANYPWPTSLGGIQIQVIDSTGVPRLAPLLFVSSQQVNFLVPEATRIGAALVNLQRSGATIATGLTNVQDVAPGIFSADGSGRGPTAGSALTLTASGSNPLQPVADYDSVAGVWKPVPIKLAPNEPVYLSIYGTGIRNRDVLTAVSAVIGGRSVPVLYASAQSDLPGLDQINLGPLPDSLRGRGLLDLVITVDGVESNRTQIAIQ